MPKFKINGVDPQPNVNSFPGDDGQVTLHEYPVQVTNLDSGQDGNAVIVQKPETAPPAIGEEVEGDLVPIKGGPFKGRMKIKKAYQGGGGGSYGRSPVDQASIERQVAAKCAAQVFAAQVSSGSGSLTIEGLVDQFHKAIQAGATPEAAAPVNQTSDVPADTSGFGTATQPNTDPNDVPF